MHREKGKVHREAKPYRLNVRRATDRWIGFHYTQNSEEKKKCALTSKHCVCVILHDHIYIYIYIYI